ncbi:MAG: D-alanine--D-alanine ligase [Planctomycetota bacterium]|nr:D-alanine--D-alanine ligase [Planctomycetota bacterium]
MRVLVLHNAVKDNTTADEKDVLTQRDAVLGALQSLGLEAKSLGCTLDLDAVRLAVLKDQPDVVFNLVESLAGTDRLMPLIPLVLDALHVPYSGASSAALLATTNKVMAKERLRQFGLPTPEWLTVDGKLSSSAGICDSSWIIKPIWEHASLGMDDQAVLVPKEEKDLQREMFRRQQVFGCPMLAERYIEGREFNLSLLVGDILPPAEIDFSSYPPGKPRIVGHAAKWDEASFEYQQTPRRFGYPDSDNDLLEMLRDLTRQCWSLFELTGFARVDFRVDGDGHPWILEVNVNPCLSPDAGFAAALSAAGICYEDAIGRILSETLKPTTAVTNFA